MPDAMADRRSSTRYSLIVPATLIEEGSDAHRLVVLDQWIESASPLR